MTIRRVRTSNRRILFKYPSVISGKKLGFIVKVPTVGDRFWPNDFDIVWSKSVSYDCPNCKSPFLTRLIDTWLEFYGLNSWYSHWVKIFVHWMAIKSDIFDEFQKVRFKITFCQIAYPNRLKSILLNGIFEPIRISLSQIISQSFTFCKILNRLNGPYRGQIKPLFRQSWHSSRLFIRGA